jgi:hypothetical protein
VHLHKKFQKIQKIIAFTAACPKSQNSIYGIHGPLGVKGHFSFLYKGVGMISLYLFA